MIAAQASTGKQGVLGPTKIYLAVQPSGTSNNNNTSVTTETTGTTDATNPPPLAPVQQTVTTTVVNQANVIESPVKQAVVGAATGASTTAVTATNQQQVCNTPNKSKVIVQPNTQVLYT